jgi:coenzyme PQQ precursor peptide PqqA
MEAAAARAAHNRYGAGTAGVCEGNHREQAMGWAKPEFCDIRFGFEITLYIANR